MMRKVKRHWLIDDNDDDDIYDMKLRFSKVAHIKKLLSHVTPEDYETHNANAMSQFLNLHKDDENTIIVLRYTRGPSHGATGCHIDGGYASATVQLSLNDDTEYKWGRLCFFTSEKGVVIPEQYAGISQSII